MVRPQYEIVQEHCRLEYMYQRIFCVNAVLYSLSYISGRGKLSHAYTHSVLDSHHVFLNLLTQKFYCLPDNYQIIDSSLDDIIVSYLVDMNLEKLIQNYFYVRM